MLRQIRRHLDHLGKVGLAILPGRGANGNEDNLAARDRSAELVGEAHTARVQIALQQGTDPFLINGGLAALQHADAVLVYVHVDHVIA